MKQIQNVQTTKFEVENFKWRFEHLILEIGICFDL
jgi:hypothetical protein